LVRKVQLQEPIQVPGTCYAPQVCTATEYIGIKHGDSIQKDHFSIFLNM